MKLGATVLETRNSAEVDDRLHSIGRHAGRGAGVIATKLKQAIETGVYADGDRLPPERELAVAFGTARNTVRRALHQLEQDDLVVRRVGSGTFVRYAGPLEHPSDDIRDAISPLQLIEARFAVEPYMTRLATVNATRRDLDGLEALLNRLEACGDDKDTFTELDGEFHEQIARCARNPLLLHIYRQINAVRSHAQWKTMKEKILTPDQIVAYNRQHRAIFEALSRRDVQTAVKGIVEQLEKARIDLIGADSM